ncbi:MAG TPA: tetratricopeptide repeat protein [Candidatus Aminicenantes bacterium]|nr:tetratricopeptide repeat protein [Candidatus Aminicenantes bacterium]
MSKLKWILGLSFLAGMLLLLSHCSVSSVPMQVLVPAEVSIEQAIEHVGIMDHSRRNRRRMADLTEGFLTRESIVADATAAEFCLKGLAEKLNASPRFTPVVIYGEQAAGINLYGMPRDLPWEAVQRICDRYRLDALIVLEHYESDIFLKQRGSRKKGEDDESRRHEFKLTISVGSGWKIYVPDSRRVIDADIYRDSKHWNASGKSRREAMRRLPDKREAINQAGYYSGMRYGERISPTWITLTRTYYSKGCPEFETAKRYVRSGDWQAAEQLWLDVADGPDRELAGKATYNLAFSAEIRGKLEQALELARKAYNRFGNRKAFNYMGELQARILERQRLEEQLD